MEKVQVFIVGAGPSGLATAACLIKLSIPHVVVEREDCIASLWRKHTYNCLKLHIAKEFCELPLMSYPNDSPTYILKDNFLRYLDDYVMKFNISPKFNTSVESCMYDEAGNYWSIMAQDKVSGKTSHYASKFLVVATGENSAGNIPDIAGLQSFHGEAIHSSSYKCGSDYVGKSVLVVGSGNSGFEIAHDLAIHGADTSIVIRSPVCTQFVDIIFYSQICCDIEPIFTLFIVKFHVMTKELIHLGMILARWRLSLILVDFILVLLAYLLFGDLSKHGIVRPHMGPLLLKAKTGRSAVIDVGTTKLIKKGDIKVFGPISRIRGNLIEFEDGNERYYDALLFATGYKSTANICLKKDMSMLNSDGLPKNEFPNHWKGTNGLYCVGFARRGLAGIAHDAEIVASDIQANIKMTLFD
uniref:Uncharacterized protein n=1 Tax=Avena sativa TaxID=4498 RepID=A0ACD5XSV9_AVESA